MHGAGRGAVNDTSYCHDTMHTAKCHLRTGAGAGAFADTDASASASAV